MFSHHIELKFPKNNLDVHMNKKAYPPIQPQVNICTFDYITPPAILSVYYHRKHPKRYERKTPVRKFYSHSVMSG